MRIFVMTLLMLFIGDSVRVAQANPAVDVAVVDFDRKTPIYVFCYGFAGYGDKESGKSKRADGEMKVVAPPCETGGNGGACGESRLDSSEVSMPAQRLYDYLGWSVGVHCNMAGKSLPSANLGDYRIEFDAKVEGTKELSSSKLLLRFVAPDGANEVGDPDEDDDIVLILVKGDKSNDGCFSLTADYQTFVFGLGDMLIREGAVANLSKHALKGIDIILQAQGTLADIGKDSDNVVRIDNIRLFKK